MSYQPRRVSPTGDVAADAGSTAVGPVGPGRRVAPSVSGRAFARGGIALAAVTTVATVGAIAVSNLSPVASAAAGQPGAGAPTLAVATARALTLDASATPAGAAARSSQAAVVGLTRLVASGNLNVRAAADADAKLLGTLKAGDRVSATSDLDGDYRKIEYDDGYGWVLAKSLSDQTDVAVADGTTMAPCPRGSKVEYKLRQDTIHIYRSVCALFPGINAFGGWRAGGMQFHKNGRALDMMLTPHAESALGWRIANYLIKHHKEFNINHIIFEQKIWTPQTPRWRHMADRGSITANHFNHVHVAINA